MRFLPRTQPHNATLAAARHPKTPCSGIWSHSEFDVSRVRWRFPSVVETGKPSHHKAAVGPIRHSRGPRKRCLSAPSPSANPVGPSGGRRCCGARAWKRDEVLWRPPRCSSSSSRRPPRSAARPPGTTFTLTPVSGIELHDAVHATTTTRGTAIVVRPGATVHVRGSGHDHVQRSSSSGALSGSTTRTRHHNNNREHGRGDGPQARPDRTRQGREQQRHPLQGEPRRGQGLSPLRLRPRPPTWPAGCSRCDRPGAWPHRAGGARTRAWTSRPSAACGSRVVRSR